MSTRWEDLSPAERAARFAALDLDRAAAQVRRAEAVASGKDRPTLRDRFAMAALGGWIAHDGVGVDSCGLVAKHCYRYADAMIAERADWQETGR